MKEMDPNYTSFHNNFVRRIRVSFQMWEYKHSMLFTVRNNANIYDNLSFLMEELYYDLNLDNPINGFTLYHEEEGDLDSSDDEGEGYEFLLDMVSGVEVLSCYEERSE